MMKRFARIAVFVALTLAAPGAACAQYATGVTEHDWTVVVAGHRVGLEQHAIIPYETRWTRVHWAFGSFDTKVPARTIALSAGGVLAAIGVGLVYLIGVRATSSRGKKARDD